MKHLRHIALLALFIFYPLASTARGATMLDSLLFRFKTYSTLCSPEKVYLHFDRSCHTAGDTAVELRSPRGHSRRAPSGCGTVGFARPAAVHIRTPLAAGALKQRPPGIISLMVFCLSSHASKLAAG